MDAMAAYSQAQTKKPICIHCGHQADYHGTTWCNLETGSSIKRQCDCPGWERDVNWPPEEA